jgi:hypothetical protein
MFWNQAQNIVIRVTFARRYNIIWQSKNRQPILRILPPHNRLIIEQKEYAQG